MQENKYKQRSRKNHDHTQLKKTWTQSRMREKNNIDSQLKKKYENTALKINAKN